MRFLDFRNGVGQRSFCLAERRARDYYEVLGVPGPPTTTPSAGVSQARAGAPSRRVRQPKAEERFRELTGAYTVLFDPNARSLYDRSGYRGRGSRSSPARRTSSGTAVLAEVNVDTFEAARGAARSPLLEPGGMPGVSWQGLCARLGGLERPAPAKAESLCPRPCESATGSRSRGARTATDGLLRSLPGMPWRRSAAPGKSPEGAHPRGRGGRQPPPHGRRLRRRATARPGRPLPRTRNSSSRSRPCSSCRRRPARLLLSLI